MKLHPPRKLTRTCLAVASLFSATILWLAVASKICGSQNGLPYGKVPDPLTFGCGYPFSSRKPLA